MTKYFVNFFHTLIIAGILLSFSGCGYKDNPTYVDNNKKQVSK
ncbi:hypothetical protein [Halarcobacter mediterraneus]|nr:hypothetical protein [Halarcobacter mediterraneus]